MIVALVYKSPETGEQIRYVHNLSAADIAELIRTMDDMAEMDDPGE